LVAACLRGEALAQRKLYDRFAGKMLACTLRYCGNRADAEDCLLQGFEKVFRSLATYQGQGALEGWVRRIMVREALQHLRKRSLLFVQVDADLDAEPTAQTWADAAEALAVEDVLTAIASLPEGYRTVFNLSVVEGFSHEEIAATLGISENTCRSQLFRARQILQKRLLADEARLANKQHS
jgi:RNA polymerase sigma-70 factor (ECF subfamily)